MDRVSSPPGLPLWSDYPRFVRRRLPSVALLTALGLLVGVVMAMSHAATYSATASVVLTPVPKYLTPATNSLVPPAVTIDTDAQLVTAPRVLGAVARVLDVDAQTAAEHLSVSAAPNSQVLHVTATAGSGVEAAAAAKAAVRALAGTRRANLGALGPDEIRQLRLLIVYQEQRMAHDQTRAVVVPEYDRVAADVLELQQELDVLVEARARPLDVVTPAAVPRFADHANAEVPIVSGAMLGLLCGCLVGAARDRSGRIAHRLTQLAPARFAGGAFEATLSSKEHRHAV